MCIRDSCGSMQGWLGALSGESGNMTAAVEGDAHEHQVLPRIQTPQKCMLLHLTSFFYEMSVTDSSSVLYLYPK
eukprot:3123370-Amphidinium_carterae.1